MLPNLVDLDVSGSHSVLPSYLRHCNSGDEWRYGFHPDRRSRI